MRYLSQIALGLLMTQGAIAQDPGPIDWSLARRLTWDDFAGSVPPGTEPHRVAETSAALAWSYEYRLEWSRDRCVFSIVDIRSFARFNPISSWARPGDRTDHVLVHEQGHFDITELYRAKFAAETNRFLTEQRTCRGRSDRAAARMAEGEIARLLGSTYEDIWQQYRREQESYDAETQHGIDRVAQEAWLARISAALRAAKLP
jgi:hypothetical protein